MNKQKNVPELRFPEFDYVSDWQKKKLKNITTKIGSGATPTGGDSNYKESGISLFRSLNVYDGLFKIENLAFIDQEQAKKLNNVTVEKGDILLNITGASIARCCIAPIEFLPARVNQHVMIIRPNFKEITTDFLSFILICHNYKKKLFELGGKGGSTREALTKESIENFEIFYSSKEEQEKIASFLNAVDKKLTQLRRKKELLETYKSGLMQKLFSQQIRFKQNDGTAFPDWQEKKLGIISKVYQPVTISQSDLILEGYSVYGANGIIGKYHSYNHELEQIAITCRGNTCGTVNYTLPLSWITGNAMVVNVDNSKNINKKFLYYQLYNSDFRYLITGSGQPQITGDLKNHLVGIPLFEEQKKIADCLTSLDKKIEAVAQQIHHTEQFKKGLLQKMFV